MFYGNTGLFFSLFSLEIDNFLFSFIDCGYFFFCCGEQQDILHFTIQYQAQFVEGVAVYRFIVSHSS